MNSSLVKEGMLSLIHICVEVSCDLDGNYGRVLIYATNVCCAALFCKIVGRCLADAARRGLQRVN